MSGGRKRHSTEMLDFWTELLDYSSASIFPAC